MTEKNILDFIKYLCSENKDFGPDNELLDCIENNNTAKIFNHFMKAVSYQGMRDKSAETYINEHGLITYEQIKKDLENNNSKCSKLKDFNSFNYNCGYEKNKKTCKNKAFFDQCSLPKHDLRNGRLNQTAYSFFLFIRDVCGNSIVDYIDRIINDNTSKDDSQIRDIFIRNFAQIYGIKEKVVSMILADLFLSSNNPKWKRIGANFVAIDSLVHNFFLRTGILDYYDGQKNHRNGSECYEDNNCRRIIEILAKKLAEAKELAKDIDASRFSPNSPEYSPRFIQHSIWNFCATSRLNICNNDKIKYGSPCKNDECSFYKHCAKIPLEK